jgi:succinate dehydrogenase / fumarate reductase cytochrome b subunit
MSIVLNIFTSSVGRKIVVAITGLGLFLFVIVHMLGNLQIFLGPGPINQYAEFLKSKPGLLWTARLGLLLIAVLHITLGIQLALENRRARPIHYSMGKPAASSLAARTILISGLMIFSFLMYHLLQFTVGVTNPEYLELRDIQGRHDVYAMMVQGLSHFWVSVFYIVSMALLCLHLSHGVSSTFQSLGIRKRTWLLIDRFAKMAAILLFVGNTSIPLAVLTGVVREIPYQAVAQSPKLTKEKAFSVQSDLEPKGNRRP